jgi:hypothetical protein
VIVSSYHIIIEEATGDMFGSQQTLMKIVETNQFKQLCHLSLILSIGNDAEVKKHLAVQLKSLKVQFFFFFKNTTNLYTVHISCFCTVLLFTVKRCMLGYHKY